MTTTFRYVAGACVFGVDLGVGARQRRRLGAGVLGLALLTALGAASPAAAQMAPMTPMAPMAHPPQGPAAPANLLSLSASASQEVPQDWLSIVLVATREGSDAAVVQAQLRQALDSALAEARKAARPGQVELRTGGFSLQPRYVQPRPGQPASIGGWTGTGELVLEGRDAAALTSLAARLSTLQVQRLGYSLSREAREGVEAEVSAQAIQRFRARADAMARQFGFGGYTLREVSVSGTEPQPPMQPSYLRAQPMMAKLDEGGLPVEAGKTTVTVSVSGSVQLR